VVKPGEVRNRGSPCESRGERSWGVSAMAREMRLQGEAPRR